MGVRREGISGKVNNVRRNTVVWTEACQFLSISVSVDLSVSISVYIPNLSAYHLSIYI